MAVFCFTAIGLYKLNEVDNNLLHCNDFHFQFYSQLEKIIVTFSPQVRPTFYSRELMSCILCVRLIMSNILVLGTFIDRFKNASRCQLSVSGNNYQIVFFLHLLTMIAQRFLTVKSYYNYYL